MTELTLQQMLGIRSDYASLLFSCLLFQCESDTTTSHDTADVVAFWLEVKPANNPGRFELNLRGTRRLTHKLPPLHIWLAPRGNSRNLHRHKVRQPGIETGEDQVRHQW